MRTEIAHFKDAPEIQTFHDVKQGKYDDAYGVTWAAAVKEYLQTAYPEQQAEIVSFGKNYKVLKRENVTAFYDTEGNTLFDVENSRLEKEYQWVAQSMSEDTDDREEDADPAEEPQERSTTAEPVNQNGILEQAKKKLESELNNAKDKDFADPIINHLITRCEESESLAADICQTHKSWTKCLDYIYEKAKKQAVNNRAAVRNDVVYEWAEDYYHLDDKALEEKKAKEAADQKKKRDEAAKKAEEREKGKNETVSKTERVAAKTEEKADIAAKTQQEEKAKKEKKEKKAKNELEGQLDLFSMMGM